jgi:predicted P-loop ATPase
MRWEKKDPNKGNTATKVNPPRKRDQDLGDRQKPKPSGKPKMRTGDPLIDHIRDLDALDPPVDPNGGKILEATPRPNSENLHRIVEALPRTLDSDHATMLMGSGISPEVVIARGYRTIRDKSVLASLGFQVWQSRVPALLIPLRNREGRVISVQIRPDRPRQDKTGKVVKYDTPMGAAHRVDFPTGIQFPGPEGEVWITEGAKKADALASRGIYCLALPGVDTWSGTEAINDLKGVDWRGRTVVIAFDSDVATNPRVGKAREALAGFLRDRKASVRYLDLPPGPQGQKQGIDDYLASGHTLEDFTALVGDPPSPSPPDPVSMAWTGQLDRTPTGRLIPNSRSLGLVLRNDPAGQTFRYNEFLRLVCVGDRAVEDAELFRLAEHVEMEYGRGCTVPIARLREAVEAVARERPFHPVRDWLSGLRWDGTARIDTLLPGYYGVRDDEYARAVGKNLLVGAVARIYDPGAKLDTMVILEGDQGVRKSSSLQTLFGDDWTAEMKATPDNRDFEASLLGLWCVEFADLEGMGRADRNRIKMQLSTRADWIRLAYRRDPARYPRQSIFVSTANDNDYLKDPTGGRRFWPVRCGKIDLEALARDRGQLWAEAVHRYQGGESWWEVPEQAKDEQEARYQSDSWEEIIAPWLAGRSEVTTTEILRDCLEILEIRDHSHAAQVRVGIILKRCGWERVKVRRGSCLAWVYRPPESVPNSGTGTHGNKLGTSNTDAIVPNVPVENAFSIPPHFLTK